MPRIDGSGAVCFFPVCLSVANFNHVQFAFELLEINRIYHYTPEGTSESHPSVHDLQSTTRLAESWMLQIMDTRMGFPCPFHNEVIDYFLLPRLLFLINNSISMSF